MDKFIHSLAPLGTCLGFGLGSSDLVSLIKFEITVVCNNNNPNNTFKSASGTIFSPPLERSKVRVNLRAVPRVSGVIILVFAMLMLQSTITLPWHIFLLLCLGNLDLWVPWHELCILHWRSLEGLQPCMRTCLRACQAWAIARYLFHTAIFPPVWDEVSHSCSIALPAQHRHRTCARSSRRLRRVRGAGVRNQKVLEGGGKEGRVLSARRQRWTEGNRWLYCGRAVRPPTFSLHLGQQFPCQVLRWECVLCVCVQRTVYLFTVCDEAGGLGCCWLHKGNDPECVSRTWHVKFGFLHKLPRFCGLKRIIRHEQRCWWTENETRKNANDFCEQLFF